MRDLILSCQIPFPNSDDCDTMLLPRAPTHAATKSSHMQEPLKPRPYRLGEVALDLAPLIGTFAGCAIYLGEDISSWRDVAAVTTFIAMILPVAGAAWMQFTTAGTLERISPREWRESLAMTELDARSYLISQLKPRVVVQSLPFVAGALSVCTLPLFFLLSGEPWPPNIADWIFVFSMFIFSLLSMQVCGWCVGVIGICSRLRRLCRPIRPDSFIVLTSFKWLFVTLATPALTLIAGLYFGANVMGGSWLEQFSEELVMAVYFITTSFLFDAAFLYGARRSCQNLLAEYFQFE